MSVRFAKKPTREQILTAWRALQRPAPAAELPSAPAQFLTYFEESDRPQTRLDRDNQNGMGITIGRLREDALYDYKFVSLSHNTVRGAAGGAILSAEMLCAQGYIPHKD